MGRPGPLKRLLGGVRALQSLDKSAAPIDAVAAARRIREAAEDLERTKVTEARAKGVSWREIGSLYDISKQAAHQRFGATVPPPS